MSMQTEIQQQLLSKLNNKKDKVVEERLRKRGLEHLLDNPLSLFQSLKVSTVDNMELWSVKVGGSWETLVTFYERSSKITVEENGTFKIVSEISFH